MKQGQKLRDSLYSGKRDSQEPTASQHRNSHLDGRSLGFGFDLILKTKFPSLSGLECHHLEHRTRPALLGYREN